MELEETEHYYISRDASHNKIWPCMTSAWAMGLCGYDKLFNKKKVFWFTVTCELLMVKWVSPGESGKISRELLLQGQCSSISSFQRLGHTKQISTVKHNLKYLTQNVISSVTRHGPATLTSQSIQKHSDLLMIFSKNQLRSAIEKYSNLVALSWRN